MIYFTCIFILTKLFFKYQVISFSQTSVLSLLFSSFKSEKINDIFRNIVKLMIFYKYKN